MSLSLADITLTQIALWTTLGLALIGMAGTFAAAVVVQYGKLKTELAKVQGQADANGKRLDMQHDTQQKQEDRINRTALATPPVVVHPPATFGGIVQAPPPDAPPAAGSLVPRPTPAPTLGGGVTTTVGGLVQHVAPLTGPTGQPVVHDLGYRPTKLP